MMRTERKPIYRSDFHPTEGPHHPVPEGMQDFYALSLYVPPKTNDAGYSRDFGYVDIYLVPPESSDQGVTLHIVREPERKWSYVIELAQFLSDSNLTFNPLLCCVADALQRKGRIVWEPVKE